MAIGLQEGLLKGKLEGKLEIAVALLTQRLGPLSEATAKRLGRLSLERVEALLARLLDFKQPAAFNSKAELERWLRANISARRAVNGRS